MLASDERWRVHHGDCIEKRCRRCGLTKPAAEFHKLHRSADGLQYRCKACAAESAKSPRVKLRRRERLATADGRAKHAAEAKAYRASNLHKATAREQLNKAVAAGAVVRPAACERCGASPGARADGRSLVQAHHRDYSLPLAVEWLCPACHEKADAEVQGNGA